MNENKECAHYLGTVVAERQYGRIILPEIFGGIEQEMPYGHPGYDFVVTDGVKVDIKSRCLSTFGGWHGWQPHVRSNIANYFVILAFDNRIDLNLLHIWMIGRNEIIRGYEFYDRDGIKITNSHRGMLEFKRFDWIDKLKCLKIK